MEVINKLAFELSIGNELAMFCGAGISFESGIPLVSNIQINILKRLGATDQEIESILGAKIPFEVFMELVSEHININPCFKLFTGKVPNYQHKAIAKLVARGNVRLILTTNFDTLIEDAIKDEGLKENENYRIYFSEDHFKSIDWDEDIVKIFKLHGSVSQPESIKIVMSKIANSKISKGLIEIVDFIFKKGTHQTVLIQGYSCSDFFDITPAIQNIENLIKQVLYVQHSDIHSLKGGWKLEQINSRLENNPFRHFKNGLRIYVLTEIFVKEILDKLSIKINKPIASIHSNDFIFDEIISSIQPGKEEVVSAHTLGRLLIKSADYSAAKIRMERARELSLAENDFYFCVQCDISLGIASYRTADFIKAISYYKHAAKLLNSNQEDFDEDIRLKMLANTYGNVGNVLWNIKKHYFAEKFQQATLAIALRKDFGQLIANTYGNLGIIFGEMDLLEKAQEHHQLALEAAEGIGDVEGVARHHYNLGIINKKQGNFLEMIKNLNLSLEQFKVIGRKDSQAYCNLDIGKYYLTVDKLNKSRLHLRRAFREVKGSNANLIKIDCFEALGELYLKYNSLKKAKHFFHLGHELCNQSETLAFRKRSHEFDQKIQNIRFDKIK